MLWIQVLKWDEIKIYHTQCVNCATQIEARERKIPQLGQFSSKNMKHIKEKTLKVLKYHLKIRQLT